MGRKVFLLLGAAVLPFSFHVGSTQAGEGARAIEEVIVTARRREESIQTVPVAVSVMSQEFIDRRGFMDGLNLGESVPGLNANASISSRHTINFSIRGQNFTYGNLYSAVQPYFSEVAINGGSQVPGVSQGMFFDLENVQVLRGPQGTLFGRVTDGGNIMIQPRRPDLDSINGYAEVQAGDYDMSGFKGAINVPIGDTLAVRLAAETRHRDGYTKDVTWGRKRDDQDWKAGRLGLLWQPNDRFENYAVVNYYETDTNGTGTVMSGFNHLALEANVRGLISGFLAPGDVDAAVLGILGVPGERGQIMSSGNAFLDDIINPSNNTPTFYSALGAQQDRGVRASDFGSHPEYNTHPEGDPGYYRRKDTIVTNHTTFDLTDKLTIKNILGYVRLKENQGSDYDGGPIVYVDTPHTFLPFVYFDQWSEELQLQGTGFADGKLDFILGGYIDKQEPAKKNGNENYTVNVLYFQRNDLQQPTTKSRAIFGSIGYDLSEWVDGLRFNGGLRYTKDKVDTLNLSLLEVTGSSFAGFPNGIPTPHGVCQDYVSVLFGPALTSRCFNLKESFDAWTYNVGFDYQFNPNAMAYISLRRGYRPGGFNSTSLGDDPAVAFYEPEYVLSTEVGLKADWTLGQVPARTNIAVYYDDYTDIQKSITLTVSGAPASAIQNTATAKIWGFEFEGTFFLTEGLTVALSYAYFNGDFDSSPTEDADCPADKVITPGAGGFCTKNEFAFSPEHQFAVDARYSFPLGDLAEMSLGAVYTYKSDVWLTDDNWARPFAKENGYGVLNLDARLSDIGGYPVDLSFFMTNVTDELYRVGTMDITNPGGIGGRADMYSDPRMWGMSLRYRLGE